MAKKKTQKKKTASVSKGKTRPPIVAVLGHVDHGKTSLLDVIRKTKVAPKEAGGITQSIGAYQVEVGGKRITFIDTPGHEAFAKMRARGGFVSDLVVLVIAADDGVMPQTKESLEHIKKAKVPFLVAVNKTDLPQADPEKVYTQLEKEKVLVESHGGKVVAVACSAKKGTGIDELLEMILLVSEMLQLTANPGGSLEAVIVESRTGRAGPSATVLVKSGTLRVGDLISAGEQQIKVRALMDENGKRVSEAGPSEPVEVLGFPQPPSIGSKVFKVEALEGRQKALPLPPRSLPEETDEEKFKIILKSDSLGSLEAVRDSLPEQVLVVKSEVGDITESDIMMAQTTQAQVFGFRVKVSSALNRLADEQGVKVKTYQIIYKLLEDLEEEILKTTQEEEVEEFLGKAEIIAEFPYGEGKIAGCRVLEGKIARNARLSLERDGESLGRVKISSMKHLDQEIKVAETGSEFGATLTPEVDFKIGDMLISPRLARK